MYEGIYWMRKNPLIEAIGYIYLSSMIHTTLFISLEEITGENRRTTCDKK